MTIAKDFASKAAVAFVAVAMIFTMFAPAAQAQSTEDLQTMINTLLAQIAALQSQVGGSTTMAGGVCPYTWTRDLSVGSTGADVMKLQQFLNSDPDTRVAATGVGSMGMETEYFGPATAAAVSKMQVKYRAEVLTPNGLVNPTGFFGASSRAKANAACAMTTPTPVNPTTPTTPVDEDEDDNGGSMSLSGEATLETFEIDDADDTEVQEGDTDVVIAELTVEFTDGDASISRIDVAVEKSGSDAWDAFETLSLWVDGEMVAEVDASDEDDYLDEDDGSLRFSGLDIIAMEDEELEILVGASIQNNLDSSEIGLWDVRVGSLRFFDADGVATTETNVEDIDDSYTGPAATFEIEEEGAGEELKFSLDSSNPDSTDIIVDADSTTNDVTILAYNIEAEEGDIELNTLFVNIVVGGADYDDVVSDIELVVDGQVFRDEDVVTGNGSSTVEFDIDGDVVIDEDSEITVEVVVDFKRQDGNYDNGDTIQARVRAAETDATDAEGGDDIEEFSGTAVGDVHTLVAEGIIVPVDGVEVSTKTSGDNNQTGEFTIEFEVTAVEGDFYIYERATAGAFNATTTGVTFVVDGPAGFSATTSGTLSSTADQEGSDFFVVREGETETFTLVVTVDTNTTGQHRVSLTGVGYSDDEVDGDLDDTAYEVTPAQDFRTGFTNINAN